MTTDPTAFRALSHAELFQGLSAATLDAIAALSRTHDYEEGESVYRFGDDALDVYVLVNGRVRFSLGVGNRPGEGHSVFTSRMVIGWAALVTDQPRRIATATCSRASVAITEASGRTASRRGSLEVMPNSSDT